LKGRVSKAKASQERPVVFVGIEHNRRRLLSTHLEIMIREVVKSELNFATRGG
jgi:hypothetical protein